MKAERQFEIRAPLDALEAEVVRRALADPEGAAPPLLDALRYVIGFARCTVVRNEAGHDIEVGEFLSRHAWTVRSRLEPALEVDGEEGLWHAFRLLPDLVSLTRTLRVELLERFPLDLESLNDEITRRRFVVVLGGGGGAGYGYAGALTLFERQGLQPELIAGTSIGALLGLFRARRRHFDGAPMIEAGRRLSWSSVFRVLESESRYGLPAPLRLFLHSSIGDLFLNQDGEALTMDELEIPMRIVTTGVTVEALKHDLDYYEHFLEDAIRPGLGMSRTRLRRLGQVGSIFREIMAETQSLREIVFGREAGSGAADVIDAVGFSSAIPGVLHYDVLREDPKMTNLLDGLYAEHGITRLLEGGIVNNVPASVAAEAVFEGVMEGRRNAFVLALDCFAPRARSFWFYPIQQLVRPNVTRSASYAHQVIALRRTLSPLNLVPSMKDLVRIIDATISELEPEMPFAVEMCRRFEPLSP
jgi:predicted acylesterase/phospholipase RssA